MALQLFQIVCAIGIVGAFAALQFRVVNPHDLRYLVTNLVSSAGLLVTALMTFQLGFVITNGLWVVVSAAGLWTVARGRRGSLAD